MSPEQPPMPIRGILEADAAAFRELRLRGLRECPEAFNASYAEEKQAPPPVAAPGPDGAIWGCFDPHLIAVVGIHRERQTKLLHKGLLWGMYVAPEHRRRGLGRALIAHALDYARDTLRVRVVNLGVNTRNAAAIALYESMGFSIYGTEKEYLMVDGVLHDEHFMAHNFLGNR